MTGQLGVQFAWQHEPNCTAETAVNLVVHYIVPFSMIAGWLAFGPRLRINRLTVLRSLLFPVLWMAYTLVRGAIWKWYPYLFLDVPSHGYARVALTALLITAVFGAVATVFAFGDSRLPTAPRTRAKPV